MEARDNARYIVLANIDGKKTAVQVDGIYTILPPQNFPAPIPKQIQYQDERLPLYDAGELVECYGDKTSHEGSYEKMYRELLGKLKDTSVEIARLKQSMVSGIEQDLTKITKEKLPETSGQLSSILLATEKAANNIMDVTERVQDSQADMTKRINDMKEALSEFKGLEETLVKNVEELKQISGRNDVDLTEIVTSLSFQDLTGQKLQQVLKLQEEVEKKLMSILFSFGIKLRKEENPEDEAIKRGEEMLNLLQGEKKEAINQEEVDKLLSAFLQ